MVRIHVKHGHGSGEKEFLYDCASNSLIAEIAMEIIRIFNLQSKINHLLLELEPRLIPLSGDSKATSLSRALLEAKSYSSKDQVVHNRPLSYFVLRDHLQTIEREFIAKFDLLGFSDSTHYHQLLSDVELLQEDSTQLQLAGKGLMREKQLCDYIGRNEKTKIIFKLQPIIKTPS